MKLLYALLLMVIMNTAYAQMPEYLEIGEKFEHKICDHKRHNEYDRLLSEPSLKKYDAISYKLFLDWYDILNNPGVDLATYKATNEIKLVINEQTNNIDIDAQKTIIIDKVIVNGEETQNFTKTEQRLNIEFESNLAEGTELDILIHYIYSSSQNIGFHIYEKSDSPGYIKNPETVAFTHGEPDEARYWYPCNDVPSDKALVSISAKVPKGFEFISNGLLKNKEEGEDYTIFHWESRDVMPTYLAVANASKYVKLTENYTLLNQPSKTIEIQNYVWPQDTVSSSVYSPEKAFGSFPDMMKFFEESFGSYPFEKYAHVTVAPYNFGGMEHQTATSINRTWLAGQTTFGIAHELAHHWLGDLITCQTWQDIWINEGGATWSEALYYSQFDGYDNVLLNYRQRYFRDEQFSTPICGVNTYLIFGSQYTLAYYKSGWFYHMMSEMLGRENFLAALRNILERFEYQSVSTDMFLTALKEIAPNPAVDWDTFFHQWLKTPGHPFYRIGHKIEDYSSDSVKVFVSVNQKKITDDDVEFYKMPIRFMLESENGELIYSTKQFLNDKQEQYFEFIAPKGVNQVYIDPMSVLHQSVQGDFSLVESKENISSAKLFPNVVGNGEYTTLVYKMPLSTEHTVSIIDINGRKVKDIFSGNKNSSTNELGFYIDQLSTGAYFIRISSKYGIETKELFVID